MLPVAPRDYTLYHTIITILLVVELSDPPRSRKLVRPSLAGWTEAKQYGAGHASIA